jgi:hypothetical protein
MTQSAITSDAASAYALAGIAYIDAKARVLRTETGDESIVVYVAFETRFGPDCARWTVWLDEDSELFGEWNWSEFPPEPAPQV